MKQEGVAVEQASVHDFFEIFNLQKSFFIDHEILENHYIKLQKRIHQNELEEDITLINEAYQVLSDDMLRVNYLISLFPVKTDFQLDFEHLEKFLELQDEVSNTNNQEKLFEIKENLQNELRDLVQKMEKFLFIEKNYQKTSELFAHFKFISRLLLNLNEKINKIDEL